MMKRSAFKGNPVAATKGKKLGWDKAKPAAPKAAPVVKPTLPAQASPTAVSAVAKVPAAPVRRGKKK